MKAVFEDVKHGHGFSRKPMNKKCFDFTLEIMKQHKHHGDPEKSSHTQTYIR